MEVWQQYQRVSRLLSPGVKLKVSRAAPLYAQSTRAVQDPHSLTVAAVAALTLQFPASSPAEMDILSFYLLGSLAALGDGASDRLATIGEMGDAMAFKLQQAMTQQSKYVATLSNLLRRISSTQDVILRNLK